MAVGTARPDLTLIFDLPPALGLARAQARRGQGAVDRFEGEALAFHEKLRAGFLALARAEPQRCIVIDADRDVAAVAADVGSVVRARLGARR